MLQKHRRTPQIIVAIVENIGARSGLRKGWPQELDLWRRMRTRRWISWVVVAGVLMHAVMLGRHHVFMFQAALGSIVSSSIAIEEFPPGAICHSDALANDAAPSKGRPSIPDGAKSGCPVCLASVAAYAISPSASPALRLPRTSGPIAFPAAQTSLAKFTRFRSPFQRGPPSLA
jgi:hypothetical protein